MHYGSIRDGERLSKLLAEAINRCPPRTRERQFARIAAASYLRHRGWDWRDIAEFLDVEIHTCQRSVRKFRRNAGNELVTLGLTTIFATGTDPA